MKTQCYVSGKSVLIIAFISTLLVIALYNIWGSIKRDRGEIIAHDVAQLAHILNKIDKTAGILGFDHQKNYIDFLNIKKNGFVGSEVASMNLIDPSKWDGPYIAEVPKIQEEDYLIVRTKKGFFVVPGEGVVLPNGKIIGKDIIFDEDAEIEKMMFDEQALMYKGMPLAARITITGNHLYNGPMIVPGKD